MKNEIKIPISEVISATCLTVKITITGVKVAKLRIAIGAQFLKFGAWVIGCQIKFDEDNQIKFDDPKNNEK